MNILVLSPSKKIKKDKTEYSPEVLKALENGNNEVAFRECFPVQLELELKRAVKSEKRPELIVIADDIKSEDDFRSKFAFIVSRGERKVQNVPNSKEKINLKKSFGDFKGNIKYLIGKIKKQEVHKEEKEEKYVTYDRKKTHIFKFDTGGKTAYAFPYVGVKTVVVQNDISFAQAEKLPDTVYELFSENSETYPEGYSLSERKLKVTTFSERHFPKKGDSKDEIVRKSVMLAAMCVFAVAGVLFVYNMFVMPAQQQALQSEIRTVFYENNDTSSNSAAKKKTAPNWKKLKKINKDIKGWISVNNTKIDYPILQAKSDNRYRQFYLNHNYLKQYTPRGFGSIFIDYRSKKGMNSKNIVLHGHHMEDGTMFGDLMKYGRYSGNLGFYKKSPTIKLSTPKGGTQTYKIFSVFKSNVNPAQGEYFDFYCAKFKSKAQFMNYVYNLRVRSLFNCPVNVNENDQLVTLVTCSYEFSGFRTVVVARKCRKNESAKVDVNSAKLNKNPVWPQCYYSRFRATRPTVLTFKKALKKGKINWYDGNAKLKGSEQLPTSLKETTQPTTSASEAAKQKATKPTKPPKKYFKVKIIRRNTKGKKIVKTKKVLDGKTIKLPKVKNYIKKGYKYTFKKWKVKGFGKRKYLSKKIDKVTVRSNIKLKAVYKKKKIIVKKVVKKPKTSSKKPQKSTEKTTEAPKNKDSDD